MPRRNGNHTGHYGQLMREPPEAAEAMHVDDTVFTVREVGERLKLHPNVVRTLIYAGKLKAFYVGGAATARDRATP